ncbi:MAG: YraN family protein [Bacteroidales bacterium]|nr:YraN family protein [Bacteroidales bacterium]
MAAHNESGKFGEELARQYLLEQGYRVLETNWKYGRNEADIIAEKAGTVVFVEVKTRASTEYGEPELFVDRKKQRIYIALANHYVLANDLNCEVRFDIITVTTTPTGPRVDHFPRAYTTVG